MSQQSKAARKLKYSQRQSRARKARPAVRAARRSRPAPMAPYACPRGTGITDREIDLAVRHHYLGDCVLAAPDRAPYESLPPDRYRQVIDHLFCEPQQDKDRRAVRAGKMTAEDFLAAHRRFEVPSENVRCRNCSRYLRTYLRAHPELLDADQDDETGPPPTAEEIRKDRNMHLLLVGWRALLHGQRTRGGGDAAE